MAHPSLSIFEWCVRELVSRLCQEDAEDTFAETIAEVFEAIGEATPAVAAAGGSVAAAAMFAMPSLPMNLASGVPPGTQTCFFKLLKTVLCFTLFKDSYSFL